MELEDLKNVWKTNEKKLDRNWQLNLHLLRTINIRSTRSKMRRLSWIVGITLAFYVLSTIIFIRLAILNWSEIEVAVSCILIALWTLSIYIGSVHQMEMISKIDYAAPVLELQKRLARLRTITVNYFRMGFWITPFYMVFIVMIFKLILGVNIIAVGDPNWLMGNLIVSLVFLVLTIWGYRKLHSKNMNKTWMKKLISGSGGKQIVAAIEYLEEIEQFENENTNP